LSHNVLSSIGINYFKFKQFNLNQENCTKCGICEKVRYKITDQGTDSIFRKKREFQYEIAHRGGILTAKNIFDSVSFKSKKEIPRNSFQFNIYIRTENSRLLYHHENF
jgi:ferredoxin